MKFTHSIFSICVFTSIGQAGLTRQNFVPSALIRQLLCKLIKQLIWRRLILCLLACRQLKGEGFSHYYYGIFFSSARFRVYLTPTIYRKYILDDSAVVLIVGVTQAVSWPFSARISTTSNQNSSGRQNQVEEDSLVLQSMTSVVTSFDVIIFNDAASVF